MKVFNLLSITYFAEYVKISLRLNQKRYIFEITMLILNFLYLTYFILHDTRKILDLLGMDQKTLNAMRGNFPQKTLKSFINKVFT